jgi:hypothetical protein
MAAGVATNEDTLSWGLTIKEAVAFARLAPPEPVVSFT